MTETGKRGLSALAPLAGVSPSPSQTAEEVFGALLPPLSCKKLVQMDLKLKPELEMTRVRLRPYPAPRRTG